MTVLTVPQDSAAPTAEPSASALPPRYDDQWIGGRWTASDADGRLVVTDPGTEQPLATVPSGSPRDADLAVRAAAGAFPGWAATPVRERAALLRRVVEGLERRAEDFARVITAEVGAPTRMALQTQVGLAVGMAAHCVETAAAYGFEERVGHSLVVREAAGVAACITPWNVPLLLTVQKLLPALAAGCTVVHKPSELTPLHARLLAEVFAEADLPPGVVNMTVGTGDTLGTALVAHPLVDVVSLTGSTRAGRRVSALGADGVKRIHLELGGKNASLVLDDADLGTAVGATVDQVLFNTGQTCLQWSRLLVPRERQDEAVELAGRIMDGYVTGDPRDPATDLGPLVSAAAHARVGEYIRRGETEGGARLVHGGAGRPDGLHTGYYVRPTIFADVDPRTSIGQEEIFGPVLCVIPYDDEDQAVRIVNGTRYGLHGAVWSGDDARAERVARRFRTGLVDVNGGAFNPAAPFGGFKQSGIGRECGAAGLEAFLETKSMQLPQASGGEVVGPRLRAAVPAGDPGQERNDG
ncbi:aldehyde dehydrogenase family protein [Streptomyces sp. HNM0645]|uniref:aldehyde dehydrogenase family protein n=1 Tax=Streptomyces sp. HNM0645 TaxID=2782343 RepID=UPI0024B6A802|nr:aldehyde dehydrogenase family protein [Streptomyces sp. HNM0645]MDI9888813.1 aldehyde dehydrogenase family protein [Streptomyces sp. HNM0645]